MMKKCDAKCDACADVSTAIEKRHACCLDKNLSIGMKLEIDDYNSVIQNDDSYMFRVICQHLPNISNNYMFRDSAEYAIEHNAIDVFSTIMMVGPSRTYYGFGFRLNIGLAMRAISSNAFWILRSYMSGSIGGTYDYETISKMVKAALSCDSHESLRVICEKVGSITNHYVMSSAINARAYKCVDVILEWSKNDALYLDDGCVRTACEDGAYECITKLLNHGAKFTHEYYDSFTDYDSYTWDRYLNGLKIVWDYDPTQLDRGTLNELTPLLSKYMVETSRVLKYTAQMPDVLHDIVKGYYGA